MLLYDRKQYKEKLQVSHLSLEKMAEFVKVTGLQVYHDQPTLEHGRRMLAVLPVQVKLTAIWMES